MTPNQEEWIDYDPSNHEHHKHTLYVIFHGAIAFYDDPKIPWIDGFITDLKDDHQYLCGKFLGEERIPRGSDLELRGVNRGFDSFSNRSDEFLHFTGNPPGTGASVRLDGVYSRLRFPRPYKIHYCFNFSNVKNPKDKQINVVPVFHYHFHHRSDLRLRMFLNYASGCAEGSLPRPDYLAGWIPTHADPSPLTLHVRAEEDIAPAKPVQDFIATSKTLGDLNPTDVTFFKDFHKGDDLPGINDVRRFWEITLSLRQRIAWLTEVGALIQKTSPGPGSEFKVTAPTGIGDDDPSCGQRSGGTT
jgi:hypothetical protein